MKNRSTRRDGDELIGIRFFCAEFNWRWMAIGFRLHELFEGFWSNTPKLLLEKMPVGIEPARCLWLRSYLTGTATLRCFQGYHGDIGCHTGESFRTIVFHLVCQQNIGDFRLRSCVILRRWYEAASSRQECSGPSDQSDQYKLSKWYERNSLFVNVDKCKTITFSKTRYPVAFAYIMNRTVLDRVSSINDLGFIMDEKMNFLEPALKIIYRWFSVKSTILYIDLS
jgi:hypothetical protein